MRENRHAILVSCRLSEAIPEIIRWGEAPWWPKNSLMRFVRQDQGSVRPGARYRQDVLLPLAPSWDVEVERITAESITRRFLNGMFEGGETVSLKENASGIEVDYVMNYRVKGTFNRILWNLIFCRLHDANIEAILSSLKKFLEKKD